MWRLGCVLVLCSSLGVVARSQSSSSATVPGQVTARDTIQPNYLQKAAGSSIFIYDGDAKPCAPREPNKTIVPSGSGFVVGIGKRGSTPEHWTGWKFLVTAQHVIGDRSAVVLRLNRSDSSAFKCFDLRLISSGVNQNTFSAADNVDLVAVVLPDIPGTSPTIFAYSMLLDASAMADREVKVGTNVFTVGYLYGYAGEKQNFPVTKFGKISVPTEETWFLNPEKTRGYEQAYLVELQGTPGLSGAPVMTYGPEFRFNPFQYRELPPLVAGVIKAGLFAPLKGQQNMPEGVTAIEPGGHVRELVKKIADFLIANGADVELD